MTVADLAVELGAVAPFDLVASSSLEELTDALREIRLDPGEPLVTAGEEADELFVLLEGSVEIIAPARMARMGSCLATSVLATLSARSRFSLARRARRRCGPRRRCAPSGSVASGSCNC